MGRLPLAESNPLLEHSVRVDAHLSLALMLLEGCRSIRTQSSPGTFSRRSIEGICNRPLTAAAFVFVSITRVLGDPYMFSLSRTLSRLCFGSNSHALRRSSKAFPPAPGFGLPLRISKAARTPQRAEILRRTLRKCFSVGCPRLTSAWEWRPLAPGRPRHMGTKGNNMNLTGC